MKWDGELIAPHWGLLLLRSTSEPGQWLHASFHPNNSHWRALTELLIWAVLNLNDWASPYTPNTIQVYIMDNTSHLVAPLWLLLLCCTTQSLLQHIVDELAIVAVVGPTLTSEMHVISVVGVTRIWSNNEAYVIIVFAVRLDVGFGLAAKLNTVFDFLAGLLDLLWVWWQPFRWLLSILMNWVIALCSHRYDLSSSLANVPGDLTSLQQASCWCW